MKNLLALPLLLLSVAAFANQAPDAPVRVDKTISSICTFAAKDGQATVRFDVQYGQYLTGRGVDFIRVLSSLSVAGRDVPASQPTCILRPRGGLRCLHADGVTSYELFPALSQEDVADSVRVMSSASPDETTGACTPVR